MAQDLKSVPCESGCRSGFVKFDLGLDLRQLGDTEFLTQSHYNLNQKYSYNTKKSKNIFQKDQFKDSSSKKASSRKTEKCNENN